MSMDFSEFKRLLGADPRNRDPAFLEAREASPESHAAAAEADRFERRLDRALELRGPADLLEQLRAIPRSNAQSGNAVGSRGTGWRFALAASLLIAVGAVALMWRMNSGWDSVQDYVVDHYRHDGAKVLARADEGVASDIGAMLAEFGVSASPELAGIIDVIKICPTPDGRGVHMVLNTEHGLVTVIYMPETQVNDREQLVFDNREAILVALRRGSAAIIGSESQHLSELYALVQDSILPTREKT